MWHSRARDGNASERRSPCSAALPIADGCHLPEQPPWRRPTAVQKHCLDQNAMHIKWRHRHARVFGRNAHGAAMSGLNHSLNCVRLRSSLRHACMAFSHARLVSDLSSGEGGNEACNAARRSGSALSKYAQKEPDSHMSCQAWYSLVRQIASTPAARCITRRSQSVAGVIGSSHTCAAAAR